MLFGTRQQGISYNIRINATIVVKKIIMIIKFTYGFNFNDVSYGWLKKELYRLPQNIGQRFYPLKKMW